MRGMYKKITHLIMAGLLAVATISFAPVTMAADPYAMDDAKPTGGEMLFDAIVVRPFMLVGTAATTTVFVASLPFSLLGGNVDKAADSLVVEPFRYTFLRPLGEE